MIIISLKVTYGSLKKPTCGWIFLPAAHTVELLIQEFLHIPGRPQIKDKLIQYKKFNILELFHTS